MSTGVRKLIKSESQPVLIPNGTVGGTQIFFPDNQYIRNKKLMNIILNVDQNFGAGAGLNQKYVDGKAIIDAQFAAQIYLTLESYAGVQFIRKKPINLFNPLGQVATGNTLQFFTEMIGQKVNWPKCYIEIANGIAATRADQYCLFDIEFTELSAETIRKQLAPTFGQKK